MAFLTFCAGSARHSDNLETGEETRYDYNALYMRIKNVQTFAGQGRHSLLYQLYS